MNACFAERENGYDITNDNPTHGEAMLIVTKDGVPFADQQQGVREFFATCQAKAQATVYSSSELAEGKKLSFWIGVGVGATAALAAYLLIA